MFYEYFETLCILNQIAKKNKFKIIVKVHPQIIDSFKQLKKYFHYLLFSKNKIDYDLKNSYACISYSSSAIEDALNSNVPVILFDRWKRYKHLQILKTKKNSAVEYVNNPHYLLKKIKKFKTKNNYNFNDYVYAGNSSENISNLMKKLYN